jgi:hypothetical protein
MHLADTNILMRFLLRNSSLRLDSGVVGSLTMPEGIWFHPQPSHPKKGAALRKITYSSA